MLYSFKFNLAKTDWPTIRFRPWRRTALKCYLRLGTKIWYANHLCNITCMLHFSCFGKVADVFSQTLCSETETRSRNPIPAVFFNCRGHPVHKTAATAASTSDTRQVKVLQSLLLSLQRHNHHLIPWSQFAALCFWWILTFKDSRPHILSSVEVAGIQCVGSFLGFNADVSFRASRIFFSFSVHLCGGFSCSGSGEGQFLIKARWHIDLQTASGGQSSSPPL